MSVCILVGVVRREPRKDILNEPIKNGGYGSDDRS